MSDFVVKKVNVSDESESFVLEQTLNQTLVDDGHVIIDAPTKNKYVDKDIHIDLTVPSAADPALSITDLTGSLSMGDATNGVYNPVVSLEGNANVATAGWITAGNHTVSDSNVAIGTVNQSTLANGATPITSGDDVVPAVSADQTINISEGYNAARTVVVKSMDSTDTQKAVVNSANVSIANSDIAITYDSTDDNFDVAGTKTIDAPGVTTPGFISSTAGTKNSGTATVAMTLDKVVLGVNVDSATKVTPVLARTAISETGVVDAASGAGTITAPASGAYVKVDAAGIEESVSATAKVTSAGYGTVTNYDAGSTGSITVGSNDAASLYIPVKTGAVAAQGATVSSVSVAYNTTGGNFDVTGSANIPAPIVSTAGYVGDDIGTLNGLTNGAEVDASLAKITIAASVSDSDVTVTPVISKNAATNVDASAATITQPSSGFYVAVDTAAISETVTTSAAVTSNGYGTTTSGQYTDASTATVTAGAASSGAYYVPITSATFANSATTGHTYTDISSSAPVLISEDYLYINKGYTNDVKISLAQLVPNDATITYASGAAYVLSGQSAYDKDGKLVVGTIPTYDGSYTIA